MKKISEYQLGESISIESTFPGYFAGSVTSRQSNTTYAIVVCILPEHMIDGSDEVFPGEADDFVNELRLEYEGRIS